MEAVGPKVEAESLLASVTPLFFHHERHYFPVTDHGELVGVLRLKDIFEKEQNTQVKNYMRGPVRTIDASCSLKDALDLMIADGIYAFIVTENHHLVGTVAADDFLKVLSLMLHSPDHSIGQHFCFLVDPNAMKFMVKLINDMESKSFNLVKKN